MKPDQLLNQFIQQFNEVFAPGAEALSSEVRQQMRTALAATFNKMNLVNREEFDAQQTALNHTREQLETLEIRLSELEAKLADQ